MRRLVRTLGLLAVVLLTFAVALGGWFAYRVMAAHPVLDGSLLVDGVSAEVEILRDLDAVPHIRAGSEADAMFALGFVHAQDRLWQMEFQRRTGHGRLAEALGPDALDTDKFFRALGLGRASKTQWPRFGGRARSLIEAYVAGVNEFIDRTPGRALPIEFAVLRLVPEPWTPEDVIVWSKVMGLLLSTNWRDELLRARITERLGPDGAALLMPSYSVGGPFIIPGSPAEGQQAPPAGVSPSARLQRDEARVRAGHGGVGIGTVPVHGGIGASNSWVLSGSRTATGRPVLANDPHLVTQAPALWYLAHVEGGNLNAIGATMPGLPGVILGHNGRIAWGATNLMVDNQDVFLERIDARDQAQFRGAWEPMRVVTETIRVKGARDETLPVRLTRHGPLISDVVDPGGAVFSLRWTALDADDTSAEAFIDINVARNWSEFTRAAAKAHSIVQNLVYADIDGNIGYVAPGAIPVRSRGDGTVPVPGWTGEYEWRGLVPASQWPRAFNPPDGVIVTANNQALPDGGGPFIGSNWEPGYRARRILEMLTLQPKHSVDEVVRMQGDLRSAQADVVLPWLLSARIDDEAGREAAEQLRRWDRTIRADSADAALYEAWVAAATARLFEDEVGPALWAEYSQSPPWVAKALDRMAHAPSVAWCDDVRTTPWEDCESILAAALSDALTAAGRAQGTSDVSAWRWGAVNAVTFEHRPFHAVRLLRPFFSRTAELGGDGTTVAPVMRVRDRVFVASYRQVIDLADVDRSRFVQTLGQSGHLLSGRYDDLLGRWVANDPLPMRYSRRAVDAAVSNRLTLRP